MITISYPSLAFHDDPLISHLSKIDYTVVLLDSYESSSAQKIDAYDVQGNLVKIPNFFDESLRYCVIKYSESFLAVNSISQISFFGEIMPKELAEFKPDRIIGNYNLYSPATIFNAQFKQEGRLFPDRDLNNEEINKIDKRSSCAREQSSAGKDELYSVKWSDKPCLKNFESGFHLPQVEMIAIYAIPQYQSGSASVDLVAKNVFLHWNKMTGKYSDRLNLEITKWSEELGNRWQVLWIERDYWNNVKGTFTLGFSVKFKVGDDGEVTTTANWSIESQKKDKEIGRSLIEKCDPSLFSYKPMACGTGGFWFKEYIR